jgi:MOSC domain-containing protein YiiM
MSGIVKEAVTSDTVYLDTLNLEGDRQADLSVHGGPDKAVYAYPVEHLPRWNTELGTAFGPSTFGENLTTAGWLEDEVFIGDIWSWGEALLQVSQPRSPCYKLAAVTGRPDLLKRMVESGRTGWYLRVLQPGRVPTGEPVHIVQHGAEAVSVLRAHRASVPGASDRSELETVAGVDGLAAQWRKWVTELLERI